MAYSQSDEEELSCPLGWGVYFMGPMGRTKQKKAHSGGETNSGSRVEANMDKGLAKYIDQILFTQAQIKDRIEVLGQQITKDYKEKNADLLLVGILKGAVIFMADLMNEIDLDVEIDFMAVSSYGANTVSSGDIRILKDLDQKIMGKDILIIEDIIDSGYTMDYLKKNLLSRGANSVRIAVLLDKPANRAVDIPVDYIGFETPDAYVVGYGMDFNQKLRNLPFIGTLNPIYYKKK